MLWDTETTTFNTIDEEVTYTGAETSGRHQSPASQKSFKSASQQNKKVCVEHLPQQVHLPRRASDLFSSSSRTHYQRGSTFWDGNPTSKAKTKIQPIQWPQRSSIGQSAPPQIFESTIFESPIAVQNRQLKSRRSTQPCFTSLVHLSKLQQPSCKSPRKLRSLSISNPEWQHGKVSKLQQPSCKWPRKLRSASISNPSWQQESQCSNLKAPPPADLHWSPPPSTPPPPSAPPPPAPTGGSLRREALQSPTRAGVSTCSTVSTDL